MKKILFNKYFIITLILLLIIILSLTLITTLEKPINWKYSNDITSNQVCYLYIKVNLSSNFSVVKYKDLFNIKKVISKLDRTQNLIIFNGTQFENHKNKPKTYESQGIVINNNKILNDYFETRYTYKKFFGIDINNRPVIVVDNIKNRNPADYKFGIGGLVPIDLTCSSKQYEYDLRSHNMSGVIDHNKTTLTGIVLVNKYYIYIVHTQSPHIEDTRRAMIQLVIKNHGKKQLSDSNAAIVDAGASTGFYFKLKGKQIFKEDYNGETKSNNYIIITP